MVISVGMLGSWPSVMKILTRMDVHYSHAFLDYSLGILVLAIFLSLTLGTLGPDSPNVSQNLFSASSLRVNFAVLGGLSLCVGNMLFVWSLAFMGLTIAAPLTASISVALGSVINHYLQPQLQHKTPLYIGFGFFCVTLICGLLAHFKYIESQHLLQEWGTKSSPFSRNIHDNGESILISPSSTSMKNSDDDVNWRVSTEQEPFKISGGGDFMNSNHRLPSRRTSRGQASRSGETEVTDSLRNVGGVLLAGVFASFFSPCFTMATMNSGRATLGGEPLTVYTAFLVFSCAFVLCAFIVNAMLIWHPSPWGSDRQSSTWRKYCETPKPQRVLAVSSGILCATGLAFFFIAGRPAGFPAADMIAQANPLIGGLWGLLYFNEYEHASTKTHMYIRIMFFSYMGGISFIGVSFL